MTNMSNSVDYTTRKANNHEDLRKAMLWHGIGIKELSGIVGKSYEVTRRRLSGETEWRATEINLICDALHISDIERYFAGRTIDRPHRVEKVGKSYHPNISDGSHLLIAECDPWDVPHGQAAALIIDDEDQAGYVCGVYINFGHWTAVHKADGTESLIHIKPEDLGGKITFLGLVAAAFKDSVS